MGKQLWISVTLEQGRQMQDLARRERVSSSEIARRAVAEYLTNLNRVETKLHDRRIATVQSDPTLRLLDWPTIVPLDRK